MITIRDILFNQEKYQSNDINILPVTSDADTQQNLVSFISHCSQVVLKLEQTLKNTFTEIFRTTPDNEQKNNAFIILSASCAEILKYAINNHETIGHDMYRCINEIQQRLEQLPLNNKKRIAVSNHLVYHTSTCAAGELVSLQDKIFELSCNSDNIPSHVYVQYKNINNDLALKTLLEVVKAYHYLSYLPIYEKHYVATMCNHVATYFDFDVVEDEYSSSLFQLPFSTTLLKRFEEKVLQQQTPFHFIRMVILEIKKSIQPQLDILHKSLGSTRFCTLTLDEYQHILHDITLTIHTTIKALYHNTDEKDSSLKNNAIPPKIPFSDHHAYRKLLSRINTDDSDINDDIITFEGFQEKLLYAINKHIIKTTTEQSILTMHHDGYILRIIYNNETTYTIKKEQWLDGNYKQKTTIKTTLNADILMRFGSHIQKLPPMHLQQIIYQLLMSDINILELLHLFAFLKKYDMLKYCRDISYTDYLLFDFQVQQINSTNISQKITAYLNEKKTNEILDDIELIRLPIDNLIELLYDSAMLQQMTSENQKYVLAYQPKTDHNRATLYLLLKEISHHSVPEEETISILHKIQCYFDETQDIITSQELFFYRPLIRFLVALLNDQKTAHHIESFMNTLTPQGCIHFFSLLSMITLQDINNIEELCTHNSVLFEEKWQTLITLGYKKVTLCSNDQLQAICKQKKIQKHAIIHWFILHSPQYITQQNIQVLNQNELSIIEQYMLFELFHRLNEEQKKIILDNIEFNSDVVMQIEQHTETLQLKPYIDDIQLSSVSI